MNYYRHAGFNDKVLPTPLDEPREYITNWFGYYADGKVRALRGIPNFEYVLQQGYQTWEEAQLFIRRRSWSNYFFARDEAEYEAIKYCFEVREKMIADLEKFHTTPNTGITFLWDYEPLCDENIRICFNDEHLAVADPRQLAYDLRLTYQLNGYTCSQLVFILEQYDSEFVARDTHLRNLFNVREEFLALCVKLIKNPTGDFHHV